MSIFRKPSVLPGFGVTLGMTILYLCLFVLVPLSTLFLKTTALSWDAFVAVVSAPRVVAAYRLSLWTSLVSAAINVVFGLLVAWVLVRYRFPGKRIIDGLIDLPFALPTAVAGISLAAIYSKSGWVGRYLDEWGIKAAYSSLGIVIALVFIGLPFVVRTVQPVLEDLEPELEEAAACLGARRFKVFWHAVFPELRPALLAGFALSFARALGEYGSIVFISGNMPMKTEVAPLLMMTKLEQFDYVGATAIASVMLVMAFVILLGINIVTWRSQRALTMR